MPLKPTDVLGQLRQKRTDFGDFRRRSQGILHHYHTALATLSGHSIPQLHQTLPPEISRPGAFPLPKETPTPHWIIPAHLQWTNRESSLAWARDRLMGVTTFAVDGSQIFPSKEVSVPIALVQVGWFENGHQPNGQYQKDVTADLMTPTDFGPSDQGESWDAQVSRRRFHREVERVIQYMEDHAHDANRLVFFDGSLVATYAEPFDPVSKRHYVADLVHLLEASEHFRVPLVAYIDTSTAGDLVLLLRSLSPALLELSDASDLPDAHLLAPLMAWGDRTLFFHCQRPGILSDYGDPGDKILFTYLKTTRDAPPARLEMPLWMYEAGLCSTVLEWVRAEVIVGGGYPYAIETADQVAALRGGDRRTFYRILQEWADHEQLSLRFSRKMASKVRRRR